MSEPLIRLKIWGQVQIDILPRLQQYLDGGWEPVSEVGPSAFVFRRRPDFLTLAAFRVKLRRRRTFAIPDYQSRLLGRWKVVETKANGIHNSLLLNIGKAMVSFPKEFMFAKDNTWHILTNKDERGIYEFINENCVNLIPDPPQADAVKFIIGQHDSCLTLKNDASPIIFLLSRT